MLNFRILLISPYAGEKGDTITPSYISHETAYAYPPLGLLYLAANLPSGFDCRVLDALTKAFGTEECMTEIRRYCPDVVGVSVTTDHLLAAMELAEAIKKEAPGIRVIFGGTHPTLYPAETVMRPPVDFVLTGYAENTFGRLMQILSGTDRPSDETLAKIPGLWWKHSGNPFHAALEKDPDWDIHRIRHPDRRRLDLKDYSNVIDSGTMTTIVSSRGCPSGCTFCMMAHSGYQFREIGDIIDEIREIVALGIRRILFFDDLFNFQRERVVLFCRRLVEENIGIEWIFRGRVTPCDDEMALWLKRSGCVRVQLGIEATDQKTLDRIGKRTTMDQVRGALDIYRRHGICVMGYFIIGFPHQTYADCAAECETILTMNLDYINLFILVPYPGTQIYGDLLKQGLLDRDYWREHAQNPEPEFRLPAWHPGVDRREMDALLANTYRRFYLSWRFLGREIARGRLFNGFKRKVAVGISLIGYLIRLNKKGYGSR